MTAIVTQGNALDLHLPDACVDLIVTSPPYFGLRSYQDDGQHYEGQVGDEATPTEYLDALIAATAEWMRVLKPGGSIFVNLGDKYAGPIGTTSGNRGGALEQGAEYQEGRAQSFGKSQPNRTGIKSKSLIGLPWRYAIRCIDDLGLILRAEIVWSKPNGLPESVTDRVRRSHEQVFHFVKQPRYFSAVDEVREAYEASPKVRGGYTGVVAFARDDARFNEHNPLGKLPGSVWTIPTAPLSVPDHLGVDHFAAYPPELVRRIVLGWSPREVCTVCGEGRRPVSETPRALGNVKPKTHSGAVEARGGVGSSSQLNMSGSALLKWRAANPTVLTGYACACATPDAPTTPGLVLDPFGGTGTTALVASAYGRVGISVDLSADYCRLAKWRTQDPGERARVLGVPKPEPVAEGQLDMFSEGLGA